jgi:hypothetical protein
MQDNNIANIKLIYMIITEELGFIPNNILQSCNIINVCRVTDSLLQLLDKDKEKENKEKEKENINNFKKVQKLKYYLCGTTELNEPHKIICDKILHYLFGPPGTINNTKSITCTFPAFRDTLFDIFIYNLNIYNCIWYILTHILREYHMDKNIIHLTMQYLKNHNNNYRPIYHLEFYLFSVFMEVHKKLSPFSS